MNKLKLNFYWQIIFPSGEPPGEPLQPDHGVGELNSKTQWVHFLNEFITTRDSKERYVLYRSHDSLLHPWALKSYGQLLHCFLFQFWRLTAPVLWKRKFTFCIPRNKSQSFWMTNNHWIYILGWTIPLRSREMSTFRTFPAGKLFFTSYCSHLKEIYCVICFSL